MFTKILSGTLAALLLVATPLQTLSTIEETYRQGKNRHTLAHSEMLSESEMDRLIAQLQEENAKNYKQNTLEIPATANASGQPIIRSYASAPYSTGSMNSEAAQTDGMFSLYPIMEKDGQKIVFRGLFAAGDIPADNEIGDFLQLRYTLNDATQSSGTVSPPLDYSYPNSNLFGYSHFAGTDANWQSGTLYTNFADNTLYQFALTYEFAPQTDSPDSGDDSTPTDHDLSAAASVDDEMAMEGTAATTSPPEGEEGPVENSPTSLSEAQENLLTAAESSAVGDAGNTVIECVSESFILYTVKSGDSLRSISTHYGVPLQTIRKDNRLSATSRVRAGDRLFLRDPATSTPLSIPITEADLSRYGSLGDRPDTEYAYGSVDVATGNPLYSRTDILLDAYDGFDVTRYHNSQSLRLPSLFGGTFTSSLDARIIELEDGAFLFVREDGRGFKLLPQPDGTYQDVNHELTMKSVGSGYKITTLQLE